MGLHSYLNGQKKALIGKIESLAEAESQVSEIDASLSAFHEELLRSLAEGRSQGGERRKLLIQARLIRVLIQNLGQLDGRNHTLLPAGWDTLEKNGIACLRHPLPEGSPCLQQLLSQVGAFQLHVIDSRRNEVRRLSLVEHRQLHLEHLDTWLYWGSTVLGLLFMAMGWRNVVLQVGEPIKDVAGYLQSFDESIPKKSPPLIPPLFSIRELSILLKNMTRIYRDPLTGTLVRRAIIKILAREMVRAEKEGFSLAVAIFDIDEFKEYNNHYGHVAGDALLQSVSTRIQGKLVEGEFLGRWGGEEFLVVSPRIPPEAVLNHYDEIRGFVSCSNQVATGESVLVTVSVGVAIRVPGQTEDDLIRLAERALAQAKQEGRNCLAVVPHNEA